MADQEPQYSSIFDRFWTDDFSAVPVVGPVASFAASKVQESYDGWNRAISWGISAAPAGMQTLNWDKGAREVTPGQALIANNARLTEQGPLGVVAGGVTTGLLRNYDPENIALQPDFDVEDANQRKQAFESGGAGQFLSGAADVGFQFFLDPLVLGGKGIKVARLGGKIGAFGKGYEVAGLINRKVTRAQEVLKIGDEADTAMAIYTGAAKSTGDNMIGQIADEVVRGDFSTLRNLPQFDNPFRDILASIGADITDKGDAITFIAAAAGNAKYIQKLHADHKSAYDALVRVGRSSRYEEAAMKRDIGEWGPALYDDVLEKDVDLAGLIMDLDKRNAALSKAVGKIDQGQAMITRMGLFDSPLSVQGAQIAAAWRAGKSVRGRGIDAVIGGRKIKGIDEQVNLNNLVEDLNLGAEESKRIAMKASYGTAPAAFEKVYQLSSAIRPTRVWSLVKGYAPSGMVALRGPNAGKASDEMVAALNDSKTLGTDKNWVNEQMSIFGSSVYATDRMQAVITVEQNALKRLAERFNVDQDVALEIYNRVAKSRNDLVQQFKTRGYGVDESGSIVRADAQLISQLEVAMPMMDMRMLERSMKIAARPEYKGITADVIKNTGLKTGRADELRNAGVLAKSMFEEVQSLWKAAVLMRLGYTMRNVGEGWLRSAAVLNTIPVLKNMPTGLKNFASNSSKRAQFAKKKALINEQARLSDEYNELNRKLASATDDVSRAAVEDMMALKRARIDDIVAERSSLESLTYIGTEMKGKGAAEFGGYSPFGGDLGLMYRKLASNESTVDQTLRSQWMRDSNYRLNSNQWGAIKPDSPQYWDEFSTVIKQFRSDDVALLALKGKDPAEISQWLRSKDPAALKYRREMDLSSKGAADHAVKIHGMVNRYIPEPSALAAAAERDLSPEEIKTLLGHLSGKTGKELIEPDKAKYFDKNNVFDQAKYDSAMKRFNAEKAKAAVDTGPVLSPIHGRQIVEEMGKSHLLDYPNAVINIGFKLLGTLPESTLVRQPHYAEVWKREFSRVLNIAKGQNVEVTPELLKSINGTAHQVAMRSVNETLYTIERFSNPARVMKFIMPFFPAWENSVKAWTKFVINDPSLVGRANILWNIPNELGLVVDKDGKPVGRENFSFLNGNQERYIVLPEAMNEQFMKVSGGVPFKIAQGSMNIVTPGETPYVPGFGPLVPFAAGAVLKGKPDWQDTLKKYMPTWAYNQIAPFGEVQDSLVDAILPPSARKLYTAWRGQDDENYLATMGAITQQKMTEWYMSGGLPEDKPTTDDILDATNKFYQFGVLVSLTSPFPVIRTSKFQVQVDAWNALKADRTLTYDQAIEKFVTKYGVDFLPMTSSTSEYAGGSIKPTLDSYEILARNEGLVHEIAQALGPDAIGVLGSSAPQGEFDIGVYRWLGDKKVPGTNDTYRSKKSPEEMQQSIEMQMAWREFNAAKEARDAEMARLGVKSLQSNKAAGIKAKWDYFTKDYLGKRYGAQWTAEYSKWTDMSTTYLTAINMALSNPKFMEQQKNNPVWSSAAQYMNMRNQAVAYINANPSQAKLMKDVFKLWSADFKNNNLDFSYFYDRYLDNDELYKEVGMA